MQFGKKCTNRIYSKAVLIYFSPVRIGNRSQGAHFIGALLDYYFFSVNIIIIIIIIILYYTSHIATSSHCLSQTIIFKKDWTARAAKKKNQLEFARCWQLLGTSAIFIIIYGVSDHFQREHTIFMIIQRALLIWYIKLYRIILYCTTYHISQPIS